MNLKIAQLLCMKWCMSVFQKSFGNNRALPCNEYGAQLVETKIFERAFSEFCKNGGRSDKSNKITKFCKNLCAKAFERSMYIKWTNCLCEKSESSKILGEWISSDECCDCHKQCLNKDFLYDIEWAPSYCNDEVLKEKEFRKKVDKQLEKVCKVMAFFPGYYSCTRFSKYQEDYSKVCLEN